MKKIVLLLLLVTSSTLLAQKDNFWLYGKLKDSSSVNLMPKVTSIFPLG